MPITNQLLKILDRKSWEMITPSPAACVAGSFVVTDARGTDPQVMVIVNSSTTGAYLYDARYDSFQLLPNPGFNNTTIGAGSCGCFSPMGPTGTATAGTTTTLTTNLTIPGDISGYKIRITSGPGAGDERTILYNTQGANSVITVSSPFSATITTSSTYRLMTGRFYAFINYSTYNAANFRYYCRALGTWNSVPSAQGSLPATWGTDGRLVATPGAYATYASGTASSATATTLVDSTKTWTTSQWVNYQVRITAGTGAGQVRVITASTGTTLTVATWTITPDATSQYVIEGDDSAMYLMGNNATATYKITLTEGAGGVVTGTTATTGARGVALAAGGSANWVFGCTDPRWTAENYSTATAAQNGRFIYSFTGGGANTLYRFDITAGTWSGALTYLHQSETFTTGSSYDIDTNHIYIIKDATGRMFRYDIPAATLLPYSTLLYPQGTAIVGDKLFTMALQEGDVTLKWTYTWRQSGTEWFRLMDI